MQQITPSDIDAVRRFLDVKNAGIAVDYPVGHTYTLADMQGYLQHGWDGEVPVPFLAVVDDTVVGRAEYHTSEWDNHHLAWIQLEVHPDHRHRGYGSAILDALLARARGEGRTSAGMDGWDSEATISFAKRHGFEKKSQWIHRRQTLAEVDWDVVTKLRAEAAEAASAYELVRRIGATPDDELPALAELTGAINDAPTDDLDIEDEVYPVERVRNYETAQAARGHLFHRVVARHRETGELAGHTVVTVNQERPWIGDQHDTAVAPAHRGHRLGVLVKTEMMLWLREAQPQVATIDTGNAESNDHMIAINELLGYRVMGRGLEFQRPL